MGYAVFFLVILLSNIIQGITGFAGTILAMPPSLMLVGYDTAKPVLNVLGLLSGIYVFAGHRKHVCWGELKKIVAVMAAGIVGGIFLKGFFAGRERALYALLGLFVVCLSLQGLHKLWRDWLGTQEDAAAGAEAAAEAKAAAGAKTAEAKAAAEGKAAGPDKAGLYLLLGLAGIVHGIFVSGGPLLIGYLTKRIQDKVSFRATISTVWGVLNTIILYLYQFRVMEPGTGKDTGGFHTFPVSGHGGWKPALCEDEPAPVHADYICTFVCVGNFPVNKVKEI